MTRDMNAHILNTELTIYNICVFTDFEMCYDNYISGTDAVPDLQNLRHQKSTAVVPNIFSETAPAEDSRLHLQSERGKDERIRQNTI